MISDIEELEVEEVTPSTLTMNYINYALTTPTIETTNNIYSTKPNDILTDNINDFKENLHNHGENYLKENSNNDKSVENKVSKKNHKNKSENAKNYQIKFKTETNTESTTIASTTIMSIEEVKTTTSDEYKKTTSIESEETTTNAIEDEITTSVDEITTLSEEQETTTFAEQGLTIAEQVITTTEEIATFVTESTTVEVETITPVESTTIESAIETQTPFIEETTNVKPTSTLSQTLYPTDLSALLFSTKFPKNINSATLSPSTLLMMTLITTSLTTTTLPPPPPDWVKSVEESFEHRENEGTEKTINYNRHGNYEKTKILNNNKPEIDIQIIENAGINNRPLELGNNFISSNKNSYQIDNNERKKGIIMEGDTVDDPENGAYSISQTKVITTIEKSKYVGSCGSACSYSGKKYT